MLAPRSVLFFYRDSKGRDWYESQELFDAKSLKVCYNDKKSYRAVFYGRIYARSGWRFCS